MTNSATCNIIEDFKMYFVLSSYSKRKKSVTGQTLCLYLDASNKSLLTYSQTPNLNSMSFVKYCNTALVGS